MHTNRNAGDAFFNKDLYAESPVSAHNFIYTFEFFRCLMIIYSPIPDSRCHFLNWALAMGNAESMGGAGLKEFDKPICDLIADLRTGQSRTSIGGWKQLKVQLQYMEYVRSLLFF